MPKLPRWPVLALLLRAALAIGAEPDALQLAPAELALEPLPPLPPLRHQYLTFDEQGMAVHATDGQGNWQRWIAATGWLADRVTTDAPGGPLIPAGPGYAVERSEAGIGVWKTDHWPPRRLTAQQCLSPDGQAPQVVTFSGALNWIVGAVGPTVYTWRLGETEAFGELRGYEPRGNEPQREAITALAVDSAGRCLAAADAGGMVWFWKSFDARATGYPVHRGGIGAIAFAGRDRLLASASNDGALQISDPARKVLVWFHLPSADGRRYDASALKVSADGSLLATQTGQTTVLHEVASGRLVRELQAPSAGPSYALALSENGHRMAYGCGEALWLWEPFTGSLVSGASGGMREPLDSVGLSPDGRYLVAAGRSRLYCWDLQGQRPFPTATDVAEEASLCLVHNGRLLAELLSDRVAYHATAAPPGGPGHHKPLPPWNARLRFVPGGSIFEGHRGGGGFRFDAAAPGPSPPRSPEPAPKRMDSREHLEWDMTVQMPLSRPWPGFEAGKYSPYRRKELTSPDRGIIVYNFEHGKYEEYVPEQYLGKWELPWVFSQLVFYDHAGKKVIGVVDVPDTRVREVVFSLDGESLAARTQSGRVIVCEPDTAKQRWASADGVAPAFNSHRWDYQSSYESALADGLERAGADLTFSPDGRHVIARRDGRIVVFDTSNGRLAWKWSNPAATFATTPPPGIRPEQRLATRAVSLGQSADRVAVRSAVDQVTVHRLADGKPIASLNLPTHTAAAAFNPDLRWLALLRYDGLVVFLPVDGQAPARPPWPNGRMVSFLDSAADPRDAYGLAWSPDGQWLVAVALGEVVVWDAREQQPARRAEGNQMVPVPALPEAGAGFACRPDGTDAILIEHDSGEVAARWQAHASPVRQAVLAAGGSRLATLSDDGEIALWSLPEQISATPRRLCRLWQFADPQATICVTDQEQCDGPFGMERLVCWRLGTQRVPFGQFEPSRRRPDKVAEAISGRPAPPGTEPPTVRFTEPAAGTETNGEVVAVTLATTGPRPVARIDLSVNGLPLRSVTTISDGQARTVVTLPVGETEARLRAVAVDDQGQTGEPAQLTVFARGYQARPGALRVLAIGLDRYRSAAIPPLSYSVADATDFAAAMATQGNGKPYPVVERTLLCDAQANLGNVAAALQALKAHARANDTVVIFLAGHGVSKEGEFYFGTYDLDPQRLDTTALNWRDFARALREIGTFRVLVLADTCHSGGIVGDAADQAQAVRRMSDQTGRLVFSASRQDEPSFGFAKLGHGAFTEAVLEALRGQGDANRDGALSYGELTRYVGPRVAQLTEGRQHPELPLVDPDLPLDDTFAWTPDH